jgi:hypothetical protein
LLTWVEACFAHMRINRVFVHFANGTSTKMPQSSILCSNSLLSLLDIAAIPGAWRCPQCGYGYVMNHAYRYRRSVAEHVSDAEFSQLQSFRMAGKVLFLRCLKTKRKQPCAACLRWLCNTLRIVGTACHLAMCVVHTSASNQTITSAVVCVAPSIASLPDGFQPAACSMAEKDYEAVWVTSDDVSKEGLLLSKHMLLDHLPDRTVTVLNKALQRVERGRENGGVDAANLAVPPAAQRAVSASGLQLPEVQVAMAVSGAGDDDSVARMRRGGSATDVRIRQRSAS